MGTVPPELTEVATLREPGAREAGEVGGRRPPEDVVIAKVPHGTLPLRPHAHAPDATLMSPADPLAARPAHGPDAARTLLSGQPPPAEIRAGSAPAWQTEAQRVPQGGTLMSGPPANLAPAHVPEASWRPPVRSSLSAWHIVGVVALVTLATGVAAFFGFVVAAAKATPAPANTSGRSYPPPPPPEAVPAYPPPPGTPPSKPEPASCTAYKQMQAKKSTAAATLRALAEQCKRAGGTVAD